jgi:hypothetical protein
MIFYGGIVSNASLSLPKFLRYLILCLKLDFGWKEFWETFFVFHNNNTVMGYVN